MADAIGATVRRRRDELKMSAQGLSDACAELGNPIARNSISNLENGRRSEVGIAELIVIAEALDMPPVELLFGASLMTGDAEYLPGKSTTGWEALRRFTGEVSDTARPDPGDRAYSLYRMRMLGQKRDRRAKADSDYQELSARMAETRARLADRDLDDATRRAGEAELARLAVDADRIQESLAESKDFESLTRAALANRGYQFDPMFEEGS